MRQSPGPSRRPAYPGVVSEEGCSERIQDNVRRGIASVRKTFADSSGKVKQRKDTESRNCFIFYEEDITACL